jgi:GT2 family glycosyltransferase
VEPIEWVCFIAVMLPRYTIQKIGFLNEIFTGYGSDDVDYCRRVREANGTIYVTNQVVVRHRDGESEYRNHLDEETFREMVSRNAGRYAQILEELKTL